MGARSGYASSGAPGKISFTLGETGLAAGAGHDNVETSVVSKHSERKQLVGGNYGAGAYDTGAYDAAAYGTGASYGSGYASGGAPGKIEFSLGDTGYQTGLAAGAGYGNVRTSTVSKHSENKQYGRGAYGTGAYGTGAYGTGAYGKSRTSYRSGYTSGEAPGKFSFTLGGTGYQTGLSTGTGYENAKNSAVSKSYGVYRQQTSSIRQSGAQGFAGAGAPGKISFTQDFSRVSGQSTGIQRSSGFSGLSTAKKAVAPVTLVRDEFSSVVADNTGSSIDSGAYGVSEVSGIGGGYQEIAGIGGQGAGVGYPDGGVKVISSPVAPAAPRHSVNKQYGRGAYGTGAYGTGAYGKSRTSYGSGYTTGGAPGRISFTLGGTGYQTGLSAGTGYENVRTSAVSKPYGVYRQQTSSIRQSGAQGFAGAGAPGKISFTQDFSRVSGQSTGIQRSSGFSGLSTAKKAVAPVTVVRDDFSSVVADNTRSSVDSGAYGVSEVSGIGGGNQEITGIRGHGAGAVYPDEGVKVISSPVSPAAPRQPVVHGVDYVEKTDVHEISGVSGHGHTGHHTGGVSGAEQAISGFQPASVSSFDKLSTGGVSAVSRQAVRSGYGSGLRRTSQTVPGVNPAKISFTQDFSRVSGHQTSGMKPVVTTRNEIPAFPAVIASPVAPKPISDKLVFKAPKQPVVQQPSYTPVYDQAPVQEITGTAVGSQFARDNSAFSAIPANTGFVREELVDYKQEIADVGLHGGDKLVDVAYGAEAGFDKSSNYGHSGLTSDIGGSGGFEKIVSAYKFTSSDNVGGKSNMFVAVPVDAKSEFVHSSGVAPASGYADNKGSYYEITSGNINSAFPSFAGPGQAGLLYTYTSPYISSPFSYTYTSGKGQYDHEYGKSVA